MKFLVRTIRNLPAATAQPHRCPSGSSNRSGSCISATYISNRSCFSSSHGYTCERRNADHTDYCFTDQYGKQRFQMFLRIGRSEKITIGYGLIHRPLHRITCSRFIRCIEIQPVPEIDQRSSSHKKYDISPLPFPSSQRSMTGVQSPGL